MEEIKDGLNVFSVALKELSIAPMPLLVKTCLWPDPKTVEELPVWYPEAYRTVPIYYENWSRQALNKGVLKYESNERARIALRKALDIGSSGPKNWTVCHIWGFDDSSFYSINTIVKNPKYYSCIANMVLVPTPLKALTDSVPEVKHALRVCAYNLYGWVCEEEKVKEEAELIKNGKIPEGYPDEWPKKPGEKLPPGTVPFNDKIRAAINRRKKEIRKNLENEELEHYPREQVKSVLDFWGIEL